MTDHYYTSKPSAAHQERKLEEVLRERRFIFTTDAGVFSKGGVDFGSKLLVETMAFPENARVLDVGCGYGPIGLSAAVLASKGQVTMVDINERAVELAVKNAKANQLTNVRILQSDLLSQVQEETYDVVLTNPPIRAGKETVHRIFEDAHKVLVPGGTLWVVIQKKQGAPSARARMEAIYTAVEEVERDKGYWILKATK